MLYSYCICISLRSADRQVLGIDPLADKNGQNLFSDGQRSGMFKDEGCHYYKFSLGGHEGHDIPQIWFGGDANDMGSG